jgi:preprotein translocase subunit Sec61beta
MAKETTRMPMSTAGLTSFHEEYRSKIEIKPGHVIVLGVLIILVIAALHLFAAGLLA